MFILKFIFHVYLRNNFNWQMTFSECWKYDLNLSFYGFRAWGQIGLKNLWEGELWFGELIALSILRITLESNEQSTLLLYPHFWFLLFFLLVFVFHAVITMKLKIVTVHR